MLSKLLVPVSALVASFCASQVFADNPSLPCDVSGYWVEEPPRMGCGTDGCYRSSSFQWESDRWIGSITAGAGEAQDWWEWELSPDGSEGNCFYEYLEYDAFMIDTIWDSTGCDEAEFVGYEEFKGRKVRVFEMDESTAAVYDDDNTPAWEKVTGDVHNGEIPGGYTRTFVEPDLTKFPDAKYMTGKLPECCLPPNLSDGFVVEDIK